MKYLHTARAISLIAFPMIVASPLHAADGRLEINQACVAVGCLSGDGADFPIEITASGSYLLTGNLTVPEGAHGISITASDVTLDLNGFVLSGSDSGAFDGIRLNGPTTTAANVEIRNGTIRDFGGSGMNCVGGCTDLKAIGLRLLSNKGAGLIASGSHRASARDSVAAENGNEGIWLTGDKILVSGCTSVDNGATGIRAGDYSLVRGNVVSENGADGIRADSNSSVIGNVVTLNDENGINLDTTALVKNNVVRHNNQDGTTFEDIETCAGCTLIDNDTP
jgi:hypothetical protein